jgi:hypothetical protein
MRSLFLPLASALTAAALGLSVAAPAAALPLISEVLYDASGADDGAVFVELYGLPGTSLVGLALEGINGADGSVTVRVDLAGAIGSDGLFVVADERTGGGTDVAGADLLRDFDFQNGPDGVRLIQGATVLDALGYGSFGAGEVFSGEGTPAPDPAAGEALARLLPGIDTDDNAADFAAAAPTPGTAPGIPVPEPGTAALGIVGLWALWRRC